MDTLAPPRRIVEEFGGGTLEQLSEIKPRDPQFERAQQVFKRSGAALGRALAHVSNTVNPSRVIMYLPAALAEPKPDTAGAAYLAEVEAEAHPRLRGKRPARLPKSPGILCSTRGSGTTRGQSSSRVRAGKLHRACAAPRRLRTKAQKRRQ